MKPEEAIGYLESFEEWNQDDWWLSCEDMAEFVECCITALKEVQQYREIGTVEECREAKRFREYFDELYGTGLDIANWHKNGNTEPFDNFYDEAIDWSEEE